MTKDALDRTFHVLHGLRNLGSEYFDLKIRLVHQELQDAKHDDLRAVATPGYAGAR